MLDAILEEARAVGPTSLNIKRVAERAKVEELNVKMVRRALRLSGTCSGEHGIGLHKMPYLVDEAGPGAIALMRSVKLALDPKNIMNPGKIFAL